MAKILKQLSSFHERIFASDASEKSRPPVLFVNDLLVVSGTGRIDDPYALRRCHSDLDRLCLRRLSFSSDDLPGDLLSESSTGRTSTTSGIGSPPSSSSSPLQQKNHHHHLLESLHEFGQRSRDALQRVRLLHGGSGAGVGADRERHNPVSRSDSFKFQAAGQAAGLRDRNIVPPRRQRKKCHRPPFMPQLLEDYSTPVDLINRGKFRFVADTEGTQVVRVDEDYSDAVDSKTYVTPGDDAAGKIYCSSDSDLRDQHGGSSTGDLLYCQPYEKRHVIQVASSPAGVECDVYDQVKPQQSVITRRPPDPVYSHSSRPAASLAVASRRGHHWSVTPSDYIANRSPLYENVRRRGGAAERLRARRSGRPLGTPLKQLSRSCDDLCTGQPSPTGSFYVDPSDPLLRAQSGDERCRDNAGGLSACEMSRRLMYETAFDSSATRPVGRDPDMVSRMASQPVGYSESRRGFCASSSTSVSARQRPLRSQQRDFQVHVNGESLPKGNGASTERRECSVNTATGHRVVSKNDSVQDHRADRTLSDRLSDDGSEYRTMEGHRLQYRVNGAGAAMNSKANAIPSPLSHSVSVMVRPSTASGLHDVRGPRRRPHSLCSDDQASLKHRYACLEPATGGRARRAVCPSLESIHGASSSSGHSSLSSLESLRSSACGDSDSSSLSVAGRVAVLGGGSGVALRFPSMLSPISDRSQEPDSPADALERLRLGGAEADVPSRDQLQQQQRHIFEERCQRHLYRPGSALRGSDSGISVRSHPSESLTVSAPTATCDAGAAASSAELADLPFDMPKLRRRQLPAPGNPSTGQLQLPQQSRPCSLVSTTSDTGTEGRSRLSLGLADSVSAGSSGSAAGSLGSLSTRGGSAVAGGVLNIGLPLGSCSIAAVNNGAAVTNGLDSLGCQNIDLSLPLHRQIWYHGAITRVEAEMILRKQAEGSYLVRISESSRLDYSLSLKSARGFMHMKIRRDPAGGRYILGQFSKPFESIAQMIQHYSRTKLPIRGAEHMSLLHPVPDEQFL